MTSTTRPLELARTEHRWHVNLARVFRASAMTLAIGLTIGGHASGCERKAEPTSTSGEVEPTDDAQRRLTQADQETKPVVPPLTAQNGETAEDDALVTPDSMRLAVSAYGICQLDDEGQAYCQGHFYGTSLTDRTHLPDFTAIEGTRGLEFIDGGVGICGLDKAGLVRCWGAPFGRNLREPVFDDSLTVASFPAFGHAKAIEMGVQFGCLLRKNDTVECFGDQLYYGTITAAAEPDFDVTKTVHAVPGLKASRLSCGSHHCCALTTDEDGVCWGTDFNAELGRDKFPLKAPKPAAVVGLPERLQSIQAAGRHSCALDTQGQVYCWGMRHDVASLPLRMTFKEWDKAGRPGDVEVREDEPQPDVKTQWVKFEAAGLAESDYCASIDRRRGDYRHAEWPCAPHARPVDGLPAPAIDIAVGSKHACALTDAGDVYCWGEGSDGQSGTGEMPEHFGPTRVPIDDVDEIMASGARTCALKGEALWCWGGVALDVVPDEGQPSPIVTEPVQIALPQ